MNIYFANRGEIELVSLPAYLEVYLILFYYFYWVIKTPNKVIHSFPH